MCKFIRIVLCPCSLVLFFNCLVLAQTDLRITGAQVGFPVAVPRICDLGDAGSVGKTLIKTLTRDLQISGYFKVLDPTSFVETPGKCNIDSGLAYSDWSVISAEGLVKGDIALAGNTATIRLYLHDVLQQRAVIGKKYEVDVQDIERIAHRFANEIVAYFTGEPGVFGTQIAYVNRMGRFKELFLMDMDGSNPQQLTYDKGLVLSPAWSPSGDQIIYTSYVTRRPELYITTPGIRRARRITNRGGLELGAEFSPDGTKIVSASSVSGVTKIVLFDLRGKLLGRLTSSSAIDVSPTYSPDGRYITFCSNRGGSPQIYVMSPDGTNVKRVSFADSSYCTSPAWSPKGDKLAFVCRSARGSHQIFLGPIHGGPATQITYSGNNEDPAWSPDGRYLAISSTKDGGPRSLYLLSLQSGKMTRITAARREHSQPAWSPRLE